MSTPASGMHAATSLRLALRAPSSDCAIADWLFSPSRLPPTLSPPELRSSLALKVAHTIQLFNTAFPASAAAIHSCDKHFVPVSSRGAYILGFTTEGTQGAADDPRLPIPAAFKRPSVARFVFDSVAEELLLVCSPPGIPLMGIIAIRKLSNQAQACFRFTVPAHDYSFDALPSLVLSLYSNIESAVEHRPPRNPQHSRDPACVPVHESFLGDIPSIAEDSFAYPDASIPHLDPTPALSMDAVDSFLDSPRAARVNGESHACSPHSYVHLPPLPVKLVSDMPRLDSSAESTTPEPHQAFSPLSVSHSPAAPFAQSRFAGPLAALLISRAGAFRGPFLRIDTLQPVTATYETNFTGAIDACVTQLRGQPVSDIERTFADMYYLGVLSVAPDQHFIHIDGLDSTTFAPPHAAIRRENEDLHGDDESQFGVIHEAGRETTYTTILPTDPTRKPWAVTGVLGSVGSSTFPRIAPAQLAPRFPPPATHPDKMPVATVVSKELQQKRMLQARKHRNRMSAARCNLRRREWLEEVPREIERNRKRAEELLSRRREVKRENDRLKSLVAKTMV